MDPIEFPLRYKKARDAETAGFIASAFAYGKVGLFKPVVQSVLAAMGGKSPHAYLMEFNLKKEREKFAGIRYRFQTEEDVVCLLYLMSVILKRHGSLKKAFMDHYTKDDENTGPMLTGVMDEFGSVSTKAVYGRNVWPRGLAHLLPSLKNGGACKRGCLFLRWMVRRADIDLGLWKGISPEKLVIPLDTHIARVSRCLGLTSRASSGWKTAVQITGSLKKLDPADPLKYDFALCHRGISGLCGTSGSGCEECSLKGARA